MEGECVKIVGADASPQGRNRRSLYQAVRLSEEFTASLASLAEGMDPVLEQFFPDAGDGCKPLLNHICNQLCE